MLNHHIQKGIIYRLALESPLRFTDLKPDEIDNKLFSYHLKLVIKSGLVTKNSDSLYALTSEGKTLGVHVYSDVSDAFKRARSIILLAVRREDSWLMYRRNNEPLRGFVGFMHCEPEAGIKLESRATNYLKETCSLRASFDVVGSGITSTFNKEKIESYVNFSVLLANSSEGEISADDPYASYFWVKDSELSKVILLPNMTSILELLSTGETFFIDESYKL